MSRRLMTILLVALVVATGASFVVYRIVRTRMNASAGWLPPLSLWPSRNLEVGTMIMDADIGVGSLGGKRRRRALVARKEMLSGAGVVSNLYEGEPIFEARLAPAGRGAGWPPPFLPACAPRSKGERCGRVAASSFPACGWTSLITGPPPARQRARARR